MNRYAQSGARITYFDSFESREDAFNRSVFDLIPCTYGGPSAFWRDFRRITADGFGTEGMGRRICITSDPRDCLAYGTPRQVLTAAVIRTGGAGQGVTAAVSAAAGEFGLANMLDQPVRTLSGGETVILALARAHIAAGYGDHLAIASPFSWLSQRNDGFFKTVVERYRRDGRPVDVFALEGEDRTDPVPPEMMARAAVDTVDLTLTCEHLDISLQSPVTAMTAPPAVARVADFSDRLSSPCFIEGDNGQGKSLLARALCGAVPSAGIIRVRNASGLGRPRLLFQDVIGQTLLRSPEDLIQGPADERRRVRDCLDRLQRIHAHAAGQRPISRKRQPDAPGDRWSLLEIKQLLIALRLCRQPSVLILDEPDWGLARDDAVALVTAAIEAAHGQGVPVMLISHKPWWQAIACSRLHVSKQADETEGRDPALFTIHLQSDRQPR